MTFRNCCLGSMVWFLACSGATVSPNPDAGGGNAGAAGGNAGAAGGNAGGAGGQGGNVNPGSGGQGGNCGLVTVKLEKRPPEVVMVFDRSSSMTATVPGTANSRFVEATVAIFDVLAKTNDTVMWGLKMFPTGVQCGVTPGVDVPVGAQTAPAVTAAITAMPPGTPAGTPTHLAVAEATAQLRMRTTDNAKYILLATDGEPNCPDGGDVPSVAAIAAATAAGFHTFVVGIATAGTTADTVLNAMAEAGGEARAGATKYYPATVRDELTTTLTQITGQITNCVYPLAQKPPSPNDVAVNVGTMRIARDATNGWTYGDGMNSVVLKGTACDLAKSGQAGDVTIVLGCPGIIIP